MWKYIEDNFIVILVYFGTLAFTAGKLIQKNTNIEQKISIVEDRVKTLEKEKATALLLELKFNMKKICEALNVEYIEIK